MLKKKMHLVIAKEENKTDGRYRGRKKKIDVKEN